VLPQHWPRLQEEMSLRAPLFAPHVVYLARARHFYAVAVGRRPRMTNPGMKQLRRSLAMVVMFIGHLVPKLRLNSF
jgi:hypothetical protein